MLKRTTLASLAILMVASLAVAGDTPWFDMDNCAMCKNVYKTEGLVENMTWEQVAISNGIVSITVVSEEFLPKYRKAHADMKETGKQLMAGEKLDMCGSCMALGACMMKGVSQEYVETKTGDVWIVTSEDKEVVAELQTWAKRNTEEAAKMMKKKKG